MDRSSMSSARLRSDILSARESRQKLLDRRLASGCPTTIILSLNIPGADKHLPGAQEFFDRTMEFLYQTFPDAAPRIRECDVLGPWALLNLGRDPLEVKQRCVELETEHPASRLIDLDVYDHNGIQLDRRALNLPPRPCLVCPQPAVECIRMGRHGFKELVEHAGRLLADFRR